MNAGEILALIGRNQAGKSTVLRLLAGLLSPDSGEALLSGRNAASALARRGLGFLGEDPSLPQGLRPFEAVLLAARLRGAGREEARAAIAHVGLEENLRTPLSRSSRGVRQAASLAAAIVGHPVAVILDEPFSGLDLLASELAIRSIQRVAAGGAAVLASLHSPQAVETLAHQVATLHEGRILRRGPIAEFTTGEDWMTNAVRH